LWTRRGILNDYIFKLSFSLHYITMVDKMLKQDFAEEVGD
jgi:hypothetical protein